MDQSKVGKAFDELFRVLKDEKPNDRSSLDRCFAVVITMLEQAYAYWRTFVERE